MLRHVVLFEWRGDATDAERAAVAEGLRALPELIPQIQRYEFGADSGMADGNFDFALVADFESKAGYDAYRVHPEHVRVLQETVGPAISARAAVQFHLPSEAGARARYE